ncbi:MAG TPA: bacteriohopanetetrol glucosamine biosynthesis glycosyltransferase HpnI [Acidobacteriaceae bacterium]|jgi:ceramide glucosyltransferase|nr:bacteriohopanetetrol glucosamine biosynthesis glycosyltransferase HpnI [Acidobacteriaceae bacterium]
MMIRFLFDLGLFGLFTSALSAALALLGLIAFRRAHRRALFPAGQGRSACEPALSGVEGPPVSLLKPLDGDEPNLDAHLESFFRQDYPRFEILFCARSPRDPGLQTARRVAARFPHIPAQFLSTGERTHINAKVSSLELMHAAAAHDLLIVSDSDVRVAPNYIREVAAPFADPAVGSVTCLYRGVADRSFWSQLEAAGMSIEMTAGVLTANLLEGMKFALGPTMAVRRRAVEQMGGFGVLGPYCSDDFLLGAKIAEQGRTVVLSHHVIDHIILNLSFTASLRHQIRWMKSTRFSRPLGHLGTALTFSVPFGLLACLTALALHRPALGLALLSCGILNRMILAALIGSLAVHERHLFRTVLLYPLRDLLGFCCWAASYGSSTILWRGRRYRLSREGLMHAIDAQPSEETEHAFTT